MRRGRQLRSTCLDIVFFLGLTMLLHVVFVRVPAHFARKERPSVSVIRLTAPDVAPSIERSGRPDPASSSSSWT